MTASLWEVELMETHYHLLPTLLQVLDRFPLGSGINGNAVTKLKGIPETTRQTASLWEAELMETSGDYARSVHCNWM